MRFLGVNRADGADDATLATAEHSIALLQDDEEQDVWGSWEVEWRDLVVLDAENRVVGVMNLTEYDLGEEENVQRVRELVAEAEAR